MILAVLCILTYLSSSGFLGGVPFTPGAMPGVVSGGYRPRGRSVKLVGMVLGVAPS